MTAISTPLPSRSLTVYPVLFAAAGCHLINDTLQAVLLSIYPLLHQAFALNFTQIGAITMVFQLTASVLQPLIGTITDRKPLPYILPVAPSFTLAGLVLLATATSYAWLLVAAGCIGIGSAIFHPDASRVSRLASGGRFGFAQSVFQVGGNVGTAIGPLLAAWIVLPRGLNSAGWFTSMAFASIIILCTVGRWYSNHLTQTRKATPAQTPALNRAMIVRALIILILLMFSKFVYMASIHSFYTFYLIEKFGLTAEQAQIYLFIFLGAVAVGTFAGGPIGDKIGRKSVIWFSILGTLPFSLALPYAGPALTIALSIAIGLILSSAFSAMIVYAQELMPGRVGMISGLFFGIAFGMGGTGAAALGALADMTSVDFVYKVVSFLPALGLLALLLPDPRKAS